MFCFCFCLSLFVSRSCCLSPPPHLFLCVCVCLRLYACVPLCCGAAEGDKELQERINYEMSELQVLHLPYHPMNTSSYEHTPYHPMNTPSIILYAHILSSRALAVLCPVHAGLPPSIARSWYGIPGTNRRMYCTNSATSYAVSGTDLGFITTRRWLWPTRRCSRTWPG